MLFLLSPAKSLDYESPGAVVEPSEPLFVRQSTQLIRLLRQRSVQDVATLMSLSDKLAALNVARYQAWSRRAGDANARPAVLAFDGDVYDGLAARSLKPADLKWAQEHLCILSGLYGVLRPLDRMQAYRLEMGTALPNPKGDNLYQFWGAQIAQYLNSRQADSAFPVVVNLASQEYFHAIRPNKLEARIITPIFKDQKNGVYKIISFFAKKARGMMSRYIIQNQLSDPEAIKHFNRAGYCFSSEDSSQDEWVFTRSEGKSSLG